MADEAGGRRATTVRTAGRGDVPATSFRVADRGDLAAITRIYDQAIAERFVTGDLEPRPEYHWNAWLEEHPPGENPVFVCEREGEVLGWCSISAYRPGRRALRGTREVSFYVDLGHRGEGVGSGLLAHAIEVGPEVGARTLIAIVIDGNVASVRLLERYGFRRWGFLPDVVDVDGTLRGHVYLGRRL